MSKPRLYLHIGTHKTGSSAFQEALFAARDSLAGLGIHLHTEDTPQNKRPANNKFLASTLLRDGMLNGIRIRSETGLVDPEDREKAAKGLKRRIAEAAVDHHLLSAEELCAARSEDERQVFANAFDEVDPRIVVVLRNETDWRRSWANQLSKNAKVRAYLARVCDPDQRPDGDWYFDRDAILGFWRQIGPVEIIDYDAEMASRGSTIPALARACGLPDGVLDESLVANRSDPPG